VLFSAVGDTSYKLLLTLHIVAAVVAFAPPIVATIGGGTVSVATWRLTFYSLLATGLLGIILIVVSDDVWEFSQTWISLALLVWIVMAGVGGAVVVPALRDGVRARAALGAKVLTGLLVVMVYLMVFKPGLPT
jgi:hypothetical protein